jgi:hypothetical protein
MTLAYNEICQFSVNYDSVMLYSTGPWSKLEPIREEHCLGVSIWGRLLVLSANIRLGWKDLLGPNTLGACAKIFYGCNGCLIEISQRICQCHSLPP